MGCSVTCIRTNGQCQRHGSRWLTDRCLTETLLERVGAERERQFARYGSNRDLRSGTGPDAQWLLPLSVASAKDAEWWFRQEYESHVKPTWAQLVREEVAEAFMEGDPASQVEELLQVAALCVSWAEKISEKSS